MTLIDLIQAIPQGIWGVIIGSLLAFGATTIATRRQLRHDAAQRERDRKMQLRKDVFLEAAEGVAGTSEYFMKLANADIPVSDAVLSSSKPGWLNKLYTVASVEAIEAFTVASAALAASVFDLLRQRLSVDDVKHRIEAANLQIETIKSIQERIRASAAAAANEAPTPEVSQRLEVMQQHWDQTWREIERLEGMVASLHTEKLKFQRQLLEQAVSYTIGYQSKLTKALIALRKELELPLDEKRFHTFMSSVNAEMLPKFQQLLDALEEDANSSAA